MKRSVYKYFLFFLLFTGSLVSQQLRFKYITNEEGLSTNYVTSIMQDEKGFMWFGTQDGLNKFDGNNFHLIFLRNRLSFITFQ